MDVFFRQSEWLASKHLSVFGYIGGCVIWYVMGYAVLWYTEGTIFYARERIQNLYTCITYICLICRRLPCVFSVSHRRHRCPAVAPIGATRTPPQYPHQLHAIAPGHREESRGAPHHISHPQYHPETLRCLDAQNQIWKKETCKTRDTSFSILNLHPHLAASVPDNWWCECDCG